jgi:ribosomal protein L3 glutamine methyltransferase
LINAFDEAAYLTLYALGLPPDQLAPHLDLRPTPKKIEKVLQLFERRIRERKPAAYLTGEAWLGEFRFHVDERVIVPRSYIAELLRNDLAPWIPRAEKIRSALDLCTGSGCLAVMLAYSFPRARIDAVDISGDALKVARRNVAEYALQDRIRLIRSDLFAALAGRRYDLIVSNPPYVTAASMRRLPREYRHEPRLALAGGRNGLEITRAILRDAASSLNSGGLLVMEVGHNRAAVERAFPRTAFTWAHTRGGDDCVFLIYREQLAELNLPADRGRAGAA